MEDNWDLISTYTRQQAIDDGVLIDVTDTALQTGFKLNTVVTSAVFADFPDITPLLLAFRLMIELSGNKEKDLLKEVFTDSEGFNHEVWLHVGAGDTPIPVLTLMYPEDW